MTDHTNVHPQRATPLQPRGHAIIVGASSGIGAALARKLAFVTILNKARNYLLGYVFRREEYPWIQGYYAVSSDWMGRGVEFATQPFDLPTRDVVEMNRMFDTPTYRWLPAKSMAQVEYSAFLEPWTRN